MMNFPVILALASLIVVTRAWPQPAESVEWEMRRHLGEYKIYASVNLDTIDLPPHTLAVNVSMTIDMSDESCPVKNVNVFANMFGIPVVSRDGEAFPNNTYSNASVVQHTSVPTNNKTVTWILHDLLPGPLMLMAVMPRPDSRIKQQGLGHSCVYFMTTRVRVLHLEEPDVTQIHMDQSTSLNLSGKSQHIISFPVPMDSVQYEVQITGCGDTPNGHCPANISVWETLDLELDGKGLETCNWVNGSCLLQVTSPRVSFLNYLVVSASEEANVSLEVVITSLECKQDFNKSLSDLHSESSLRQAVSALWINSTCIYAGQLGRQTPTAVADGSTFSDHFVTWDHGLVPRTVLSQDVPDGDSFLVRRFMLRSTDTGSTLRLDVGVGPEEEEEYSAEKAENSIARVSVCLSPHRLAAPNSCDAGKLLQVSTGEGHPNKHHTIVPYPPAGVWYLSLHSDCFSKDNKTSKEVLIPCEQPVKANMTLHLSPCVDGGCNSLGSCNLYVEGSLLISACDCFSGWRGYGCNDGSHAESEGLEKLAIYLLTLSNLAFLPGICLAFYRKFYVEAFVFAYTMFFSTFYHACDTSRIHQLCILDYNTLSFGDFFASLMSFWVTLMSMSRIPAYTRAFLHIVGAVTIAVGEVHNRHGLLEQMLPLLSGVIVMLLSWVIESYKRKRLFPSLRRLLKFVVPGVSLAVLGLILNLALETQENYKYVHSAWHVLEAFSICFLLPPHFTRPGSTKVPQRLLGPALLPSDLSLHTTAPHQSSSPHQISPPHQLSSQGRMSHSL